MYWYDDDTTHFGLSYHEPMSVIELIRSEGIELSSKRISDTLMEDIERCISQGQPVIVWVDCYHEPHREDTYNKTHWPHSLLIYGYDRRRFVCNVVEHDGIQSLNYRCMEMSYSDIENAYYGYVDQFLAVEDHDTFWILRRLDSPDNTSEKEWKERYQTARRLLSAQAGTEHAVVDKTVRRLDCVMRDESLTAAHADIMIAGLTEIINGKN